MSNRATLIIIWAPRILTIAFALFISIFALDAFGEGKGFWLTLGHLLMHLVPTFLLLLILILAWRWAWVGAACYAALAVQYVFMAWRRPNAILAIAGPLLLMAGLFLWSWLLRHRLRQGS